MEDTFQPFSRMLPKEVLWLGLFLFFFTGIYLCSNVLYTTIESNKMSYSKDYYTIESYVSNSIETENIIGLDVNKNVNIQKPKNLGSLFENNYRFLFVICSILMSDILAHATMQFSKDVRID